jgi:predicted protein tyrosine phosphatase
VDEPDLSLGQYLASDSPRALGHGADHGFSSVSRTRHVDLLDHADPRRFDRHSTDDLRASNASRIMTLHVLFVCGKNRLRSPTAEQLFADWPGLETASAGVNHDADVPVSSELLTWADIILVMESTHRTKLTAKFAAQLRHKRIGVLDIPDDFEFMDPALVERLKRVVPRHLPSMTSRPSKNRR